MDREEPMTTFEFDSNSASVRCVILNQAAAKLWDPTAPGWIARPPDGSIPPSCILTPVPFATTQKLKGLWSLPVSIDPADLIGASVAVFSADASGALGDRIGYYPSPYSIDTRFVQGGWHRSG
jgi:hypothetical protein